MIWPFSKLRRKPAPMQVDLSFATSAELIGELHSRSRVCVVILAPLTEPNAIKASYGGHGEDDNGPRPAELLGFCNFVSADLRRRIRGRA